MFRYAVSILAAGMLLARGDSMPTPDGFQIRDEGTLKGRAVSINCSGAGITCAVSSGEASFTVPGGGGGSTTIADEGVALAAETTLNFTGAGVTCVDNAGSTRTDCTIPGGGGVDLSAEPFITKTASANLSNEFALGSLATALLINTTTTGVPTAYGGAAACTNQFVTAISAVGATTCTTDTLASAQHANQGTTTTLLHGNAAGNPAFSGVALADFVANLGTTTTVLHGNAAGQPSYGSVSLTADVTGTLGVTNGGTAQSAWTANDVLVGTGVNTVARSNIPSCSNATTSKLLYNNATQAFTCGTDQTGAAGGGYTVVDDEGVALAGETTLNFIGAGVTCVDNAVGTTTDCTIPGGGPDLSAEPFITKVASANLSNEFALGSLATAILINTTTTGVPTAYAGATSCTNQFFTGLSAVGASTCTTATLSSAQFANQGTTTTVLHGNAAGNPSFAAVNIVNDTTGTLTAARGGTGTTAGLGGCVTLGTATGATTTVGPVTWAGTFNSLYVNYEITGYNGGTPVGRVLVGAASISTTALTDGSSGYEGVAGTLTNMLSIPGAPLAITLSAIGRAGTYHLFGRSGALKRYWIEGQEGNASVSSAPVVYRSMGNFSDLSTNLPIQRAQLTVYDTLTATSASAQTFNSGTTVTVIGCP